MKHFILFILSLITTLSLSAQDIDDIIDQDSVASAEVTAVTPVLTSSPTTTTTVKRFGYLSYKNVLEQMPEYKDALASIEKLKSYYDKEMERAEQEFSKKFAEYVDGQKDMPENIMLKRQKELQQLMEQSMTFKQEAQRLLAKSRKEIMQPLRDKLTEAIQKVGARKYYSYILNTDANAVPYINPAEGEDVTEAVLAQIKK